jgi:hypothetical protein
VWERVEEDRRLWWDMLELRENDPRRGPIEVRWLAGLTVTIRLEELATIMSVTCRNAR